MARNIRSGVESRTARLKLPITSNPHWVSLAPGLGLGYRRNSTAGTWVVRIIKPGQRRYAVRNIGIADDYADANDIDVLTYWQAQAKARKLDVDGNTPQQPAQIATVSDALDRYRADLSTRGGDQGNASRLRGHLSKALLLQPVALLGTAELRRWRDGLAKRLQAATVNRLATILKAALNLAAEQDERIANRRAWEIGAATLPGAETARNVILPEPAVRDIVTKARALGPEFGLLVEVAAVSGARISQIIRIEVQDLMLGAAPRLNIPVSKKGRGTKAVPSLTVPISADLASRLRAAAADRPPTAPLLIKPSGSPWRKSDQARPFARVVRAARLDPEEVSMYALRHTNIVRQLLRNVPVRVVAVQHDTSIQMIERSYSRYIGAHADELARAAMLDIPAVAAANVVVPLHSK